MSKSPQRPKPRNPKVVSDIFRAGAERRLWLQLGFGRLVIRLMVVGLIALATGLFATQHAAAVAPSAASLSAAVQQVRIAPAAPTPVKVAPTPKHPRTS